MRDSPDYDDADELNQFTGLTKRAARLGFTLERTAAGYRLNALGVVMHRTDLDHVDQFLKDRLALGKNL